MQTFLPYSDFTKSASCLDYRRLGKQRVEAWQIYKSITEKKYGWKNHPIVKMWKGYEDALLYYGYAICKEWIKRGYKDTMLSKFLNEIQMFHLTSKKIVLPRWLGNEELHASHRSNLLRKDKAWYSQFGWTEPDNLEYIWVQ